MRRWVMLALLVVALGVGAIANSVTENLLPRGDIGSVVAMGEDAQAYPFTVHVHSATAAETAVEEGLFDNVSTVGTAGVFVIVDLSYAAHGKDRLPSGAGILLRDGQGREFPVSRRVGSGTWMAGADIWVRGDLPFEVARDSLGSLELVFMPTLQIVGPMPMRYVVVPLNLDPAAVVDSVEITDSRLLAEGER